MGTPGSISFSLGGGGKSSARKPGGNGVGFNLGRKPQKAAPIADIFGGAEASDDEEQLGKQDQSNKRQRLNSSGCLNSLDASQTTKCDYQCAALATANSQLGARPSACPPAKLPGSRQQGCKWEAYPLLNPLMPQSYNLIHVAYPIAAFCS